MSVAGPPPPRASLASPVMTWQVTWQPLHELRLWDSAATGELRLCADAVCRRFFITHATPMPFKPTETDKEWKARLKKMQDDASDAPQTFPFTATAEQLVQIEATYMGGGGSCTLCVNQNGELGCDEDDCPNPSFGKPNNCRAQFHAAKHVMMHQKKVAADAAMAASRQCKLGLGGTSKSAGALAQSTFVVVKPPSGALADSSAAKGAASSAADSATGCAISTPGSSSLVVRLHPLSAEAHALSISAAAQASKAADEDALARRGVAAAPMTVPTFALDPYVCPLRGLGGAQEPRCGWRAAELWPSWPSWRLYSLYTACNPKVS